MFASIWRIFRLIRTSPSPTIHSTSRFCRMESLRLRISIPDLSRSIRQQDLTQSGVVRIHAMQTSHMHLLMPLNTVVRHRLFQIQQQLARLLRLRQLHQQRVLRPALQLLRRLQVLQLVQLRRPRLSRLRPPSQRPQLFH